MKRLLLALALLLVPGLARAGEVVVHDEVGVLSKDQIKSLQSETKWKFDLHILIKNGAVAESTERAVTAENVLAIGMDPLHHRTSVRKGKLVSSDTEGLSKLGNPYFAHSDWEGGLRAIADAATVSSVAVRTVDPREATQAAEDRAFEKHEGHALLYMFFFLFIVAVIALIVVAYRRRRELEDELDDRMHHVAVGSYGTRTGYPPNYRQLQPSNPPPPVTAPIVQTVAPAAPAPVIVPVPTTPVVVQHDSTTDMLIGMEIGRALNERPVERTVIVYDDYHPPVTSAAPAPAPRDDSTWTPEPPAATPKDDSTWTTPTWAAPASAQDDSSWSPSTDDDAGGDDDSSWLSSAGLIVADAVSSVADAVSSDDGPAASDSDDTDW